MPDSNFVDEFEASQRLKFMLGIYNSKRPEFEVLPLTTNELNGSPVAVLSDRRRGCKPSGRDAKRQKEFAEKFARWTQPLSAVNFPSHWAPQPYDRGAEQLEIRTQNAFSAIYIGRVWRGDRYVYRRVSMREMHQRIKQVDQHAARRCRLRELHPDRLGREQTPAERTEYTRLAARFTRLPG